MKKLMILMVGCLIAFHIHPTQENKVDYIGTDEFKILKVALDQDVKAFKEYMKNENVDPNAQVRAVNGTLLHALISYLNENPTHRTELLKMIEFLLQNGADVNDLGPRDNKDTALIRAAKNKLFDVVEILLRQPNVAINARGARGGPVGYYTALHWAVHNEDPRMVRSLINYSGIDLNVRADAFLNQKGMTPLELAEENLKELQKNADGYQKLLEIISLLNRGERTKQTMFTKMPSADLTFNYKKVYE